MSGLDLDEELEVKDADLGEEEESERDDGEAPKWRSSREKFRTGKSQANYERHACE